MQNLRFDRRVCVYTLVEMENCVQMEHFDLSPIGCQSPWEALLCLPKTHIDRRGAYTAISRAIEDRPCVFRAVLTKASAYNRNDQPTRSPFPAYLKVEWEFTDTKLQSRIYGRDIAQYLELVGETLTFDAIVKWNDPYWSLRFQRLSQVTGRVEPIYTGVSGLLRGELIESAVKSAWKTGQREHVIRAIEECEPVCRILEDAGRNAPWLIDSLHAPQTLAAADAALELAKRASVAEVRASAQPSRQATPSPYCIDDELIALVHAQPETLSQGQRLALNAIRKAVNAHRPAHVLLNGDVGTGKTLVFLLALASIAKSSQRPVAVLVPSDLVARQIHAQACERFPQMKPCIVSGDASIDASPIEIAQSQLIVGTQALIMRDGMPEFEAVVIDEQHKLSVQQRSQLLGQNTHVIESTATPIPRTLALALFDGWTNAIIARPPVDKTIRNHVVKESDRSRINALIKSHLANGKKIVFLYASVRGKGASVLKNGEALEQRFPGKVAIIHGKMKAAEKMQALEDFKSAEKPIAVASTAIEVGVDVPDVALMVVVGADRFGVAQLHQLRGRLVRNGGTGDFVMVMPEKAPRTTVDRLAAVAQHNDGFTLAQRDLEMRGFGELLGEAQSGGASTMFKLVRLEAADFLPA